ncbi:MAG TPA: hypothetical protein VMB72_12875 [Acidimicrobiales bacterium]|nr:hypothetical protein [Acidimicrobiales bacterium]
MVAVVVVVDWHAVTRVRVGFFSFTEITDPARHRAYNAWHQLDHMPEQYTIPGVVSGQRWVSTPACRAARAVDGPELAPVHYVTLYLMGDPVPETLERFMALGQELRAAGRFFEHRRARLSGPWGVTSMRAAPRVLVSDEAVAFRPTRGVYVVVQEPGPGDGAGEGADGDRAASSWAAGLLELPGVAGVWRFGDLGGAQRRRTGGRVLTVCFLDEEPVAVAGALGAATASGDGRHGPVAFAGPFEAVVPWRWDWFEAEAHGVRGGR